MKLTTSRKISLTLLALAVAALLVDRLFLGGEQQGPRPAQAEVPGRAVSRAAPASSEPPLVSVRPFRSLAKRLEELAREEGLSVPDTKDAFVPAPAWLAQMARSVPEVAPSNPATAFVRSHRLAAITLAEGGGAVTLDDRVIRVGQAIDGFTLISVGPRTAVFRAGSHRVELKLDPQSSPEPTLGDAPRGSKAAPEP